MNWGFLKLTKTRRSILWKLFFLAILIATILLLVYDVVPWWLLIPGLIVFWLLLGGWKTIRLLVRTLPRDLRALYLLLKVKLKIKKLVKNKVTVPGYFIETACKYPKKTLFIFEGREYTFEEVEHSSNMIASYFQSMGYKKGDVVSLFMQNRPELVIYWLGLAKIGVCSALINFNLRMEALIHSVETAESVALIYGVELQDAIQEIKSSLPAEKVKLFYTGYAEYPLATATYIDPLIESCSILPPRNTEEIITTDKLFYIYTSGTTGLPKAAIIRHSRFFYMALGISEVFKTKPDDILYITLPLYHSNGGILALGQALLCGCTAVIKRKFSASAFWEDCITYKCTVSNYIGEVCRYLLAQPQKPTDTQHQVKLMFGNGLRPQIWTEFTTRFNIQKIGEVYGATEGNANIINMFNKPGAVGFLSLIAKNVYPVGLIRVNEETNEVIRDSEGLCIRCKPGEVGELVGRIVKADPLRHFDGYVNKAASQKKIIKDVFKKGDSAFSSGDLLVMDQDGYLYFKDRLGDTFRWRGENVSTTEVEAIISRIIDLKDVVVYGVTVPGVEGKAGMAAIADVLDPPALLTLATHLRKSLPVYARPIFIRMGNSLEITGTFKLKKVNLQEEAFDPDRCSDQLLFMNPVTGQFEQLTKEIYDDIISQKIRL